LNTLSDTEVTAILGHERAHLRARHDLVLEMFIAVRAAFPRFVRSASALDAVRLLVEMLADDAGVRAAGPTPLARALLACPAGPLWCSGRRRAGHAGAGAPAGWPRQQPHGGHGRVSSRGGRADRSHGSVGGAVAHGVAPALHRLAKSLRDNRTRKVLDDARNR